MPPLLPFPVLIYENKIPVNSCSINTKQLWGQAFTYTAQTLARRRASTDVVLFGATSRHGFCYCRVNRLKDCTQIYKVTLTADTLRSSLRLFSVTLNLSSQCTAAPSQLDCYRKCTTFVEYLPAFFSGALFNFDLKLTSRPHPLCFSLGNRKKDEKVKAYVKQNQGWNSSEWLFL